MAQTPEQMAQSMIENLPEKTGKDLDAWIAVVRASGLEKHGQIVKHLKTEHGMTHGYANLVSQMARKADAPTVAAEDPVAAQYRGPKAGLRPIYDAIVERVRSFGGYVELAPRKAYVSLRRSKQFALVQPSTKTRVDVGIQLKGAEPEGRLEASGKWNTMVSHRVRVTAAEQVDDELETWLREAYERA